MAQQSLEEQKRQQQYEKRLLQQQKAQQRQREKQQQRLQDKDYQQQQQEKQRLSQAKQAKKQQQRQQEKLLDPVYRQQCFDKKRQAQEKNAEKQRQRQNNKPSTIITKATQPVARKPIKSKGLKGRSHNAEERRLAEKIAKIGCICCLNQGWTTALDYQQSGQNFVSLHHIEGRMKPWAHAKVLPLCAFHHQTPAPEHAPEALFPLHGNAKTHWEKVNGTQAQLLQQVYQLINETPPWLQTEEVSLAQA